MQPFLLGAVISCKNYGDGKLKSKRTPAKYKRLVQHSNQHFKGFDRKAQQTCWRNGEIKGAKAVIFIAYNVKIYD